MDEEMIQNESILKKKGISMRYLMTHSVKDVAKTFASRFWHTVISELMILTWSIVSYTMQLFLK